jgi:hypothetical protein
MSEPLDLDQLRRPLELGEVLLDQGIGELRERLAPEALDRGAELANLSSFSNICSYRMGAPRVKPVTAVTVEGKFCGK